jgi:hypothetical protein
MLVPSTRRSDDRVEHEGADLNTGPAHAAVLQGCFSGEVK